MKKLLLIPAFTLLFAACNSGVDDNEAQALMIAQKTAELAELKKQEADIKAKIAAIENELKANDSTESGIAVSVVALKSEIFKNYIDVQGRVDADENISLSSEFPGTVTKINVKPGDEVSTGQVLAETDARAIHQQISDLQTNSDLVNQVYEKQKNLWDQKIGTEIQFLQAKTNKESMEKKMATLQEQLRMTKIISPISGTVDAVDIKLGQAIAPGIPAVRVINFSNLKVKAEIAESYASKVKKGSEVIVYFPDVQDSLITKVNFVSRSISPMTRTFSVEVLLDGKKEYHPNMVARLNINDYQSETPVIAIPVRTIQRDENGANYVYVAQGNKPVKRIVTMGKQYGGKAEIKDGLKEGDLLMTLGYDIVNESDDIIYKK